jgi:DNA-binding MarR family transcriptional regulator
MDTSSDISADTPKPPISLAQMPTWQSGILQSSVHRTIKKLSDGFLERYGLSTMHWFVLGVIFETGDIGIRLTELATKVGTTQSYLTNTLNILEHHGMVNRSDHPTDNRIKILTIPDAYRSTCVEIEAGLRDAFRQSIYQHMTRPELEAYITALQKLAAI